MPPAVPQAPGHRGPHRHRPRERSAPGTLCFTASVTPGCTPAEDGNAPYCGPVRPAARTNPAGFASVSHGPVEATAGLVAGNVTYFVLTFTDGQQLKLIPATWHGHRYVAWTAPVNMTISSVVAHLGTPHADSGQRATAVPYTTSAGLPLSGLWQAPGEQPPPTASAVLTGSTGSTGSRAWSLTVHEGPWGTCFTGSPGSTTCVPEPLPDTTALLGGWQGHGGSAPGLAFGSARQPAAYLEIRLSGSGPAVRATPVTVGDERVFGVWLTRKPRGWTAYSASGKPLYSGRP